MTTKRLLLVFAGILVILVLVACSSTTTIRVPVPAKMDLAPYHVIGLVTFSSNANEELEQLATRQFLEALQSAQPGTRIVELGGEQEVLASLNRSSWDPATLRAIQSDHHLDAIIVGKLDVRNAKPDIRLSTAVRNFNLRMDVEATLAARLLETSTGATMWADSAKLTANVAAVRFNTRGEGSLRTSDPEGTYEQMVAHLAHLVTDDFRGRFVTRRVPKDQVQSASAAGH